MIEVKTIQEFDDVLKNNDIVLVKIGQEFCGPCRVVEKTMQEMESNYSDKVAFVLIDAAECEEDLVGDIMSIPVIRLYRGGEKKRQEIGLRTKEQLKKMLDEEIENK